MIEKTIKGTISSVSNSKILSIQGLLQETFVLVVITDENGRKINLPNLATWGNMNHLIHEGSEGTFHLIDEVKNPETKQYGSILNGWEHEGMRSAAVHEAGGVEKYNSIINKVAGVTSLITVVVALCCFMLFFLLIPPFIGIGVLIYGFNGTSKIRKLQKLIVSLEHFKDDPTVHQEQEVVTQ